jgi:hypothetical protein
VHQAAVFCIVYFHTCTLCASLVSDT